MLLDYQLGQGSIVLRVKLKDSTTGLGKTALTFASSGLIISTIVDNESTPTTYTQAGSTIEAVTTIGTYAAPTATKCRFKKVDDTNHPGIYEIQIADARFAVSSAKSVLISWSGVSGLADGDALVPLRSVNPYSATAFITGVNSLAPPTNWNLESIDGSGRVDVGKITGTAQTARDIGASVLLSAGTGAGQLDFTSGVVKSSLAQILGTALTETSGQLAAAFKKFFNIATPAATMDHLTLIDTTTALTNAPIDSSGTTTLLSRVSGNALLAASYVTPDNTNIAAAAASASSADNKASTILTNVAAMPTAFLDLTNGIETNLTPRQFFRAILAFALGVSTETAGTWVIKRKDGTTTAMTVVHDATGDRSSVTYGSL